MKTLSLLITILTVMCIAVGCTSLQAREEALEGKDALLDCLFEDAYHHFDTANQLINDNPDIATGLAISDLLALLSVPEIENLMVRLGFIETIRSYCENASNNPSDDGNSAQIDNNQACIPDSHGLDKNTKINHFKSCHQNNDHIYPCIDYHITWRDIIDIIGAHKKHIIRTAEELKYASMLLDGYYTIESNHKFSKLNIHSSDFKFISAILDSMVVIHDLSAPTDLNFSVHDTLLAWETNDCTRLSQLLNPHLGITQNSPIPALDDFTRLMSTIYNLSIDVTTLKIEIDNRDPNSCMARPSLFHWETVPYGIINDVQEISYTLSHSPHVTDAILTPPVSFDMNFLFSNIQYRQSDIDILTCDENGHNWSFPNTIHLINESTSPSLLDESYHSFHLSDEISYRFSSGWRKLSSIDLI